MYQCRLCLLSLSLLLNSFTGAAPAPSSQGTSSKFKLASTGQYKQTSGVIAYEKAHKKFQWPMPEGLSEAAAASREKIATGSPQTGVYDKAVVTGGKSVGDVTVVPQPYNAEYLAAVTIGGQTLNLDVDTGSSDLWVFNTNLPSNQQSGHQLYNPGASKSWAAGQGSFSINYGDDTSLSGTVGSDTVQVGGITVEKQSLELPNSVSSGLMSDKSDGMLGLAFQSINSITPNPQPTFFENAIPQLAQPVFTVNLKPGINGHYQFGDIDYTAFHANQLQYVEVNTSAGYWQFDSASYAVGSGNIQTNGGASQAIVDTGSSMLYVDPAAVNAYYGKVKGSVIDPRTNMIAYPCSEQLPDYHVAIGSQMATIPGALLNWKPDETAGMCVGGIQSNGGSPPQVYGDILFQSYFFIFDYGKKQLGWAPHA